jgi:hypothetical protein
MMNLLSILTIHCLKMQGFQEESMHNYVDTEAPDDFTQEHINAEEASASSA